MHLYLIFIIFLQNYEKAIHTIIVFSGRYCVLVILFELYESKARLFEGYLFWVDQYDPLSQQPSY